MSEEKKVVTEQTNVLRSFPHCITDCWFSEGNEGRKFNIRQFHAERGMKKFSFDAETTNKIAEFLTRNMLDKEN